MSHFNVTYYVNGQTVHQQFEAESSEEIIENKIIKESQWIKDGKNNHVYINIDKIDMITITPQARATVKGF